MIDRQSASDSTASRRIRARSGLMALGLGCAILSVARGPVAAQDPSDTPAAGSPAASIPGTLLDGFDFGSGGAVVIIGDDRYEFSMATETIGTTTFLGVCRELFGLIQAEGHASDGNATVGMMIPPVDWDSYEDERYDPPRIEVRIDDPYATWIADADWAAANGVEGQSQVDVYQLDGLTAVGSATFLEQTAPFQVPPGEPVEGRFEIRCAAEV